MRPKNPSVATWATGNYSAGAYDWSGQPKRTAPASSFWTPNLKVPSEEVNYVVGDQVDAVGGLFSFVGQVQAFNWIHAITKTVVTGYAGGQTALMDINCVYSAKTGANTARSGMWLALFSEDDGGAGKVYLASSEDGGLAWTHIKDGATNHVASNFAQCVDGYGSDEIWVFPANATNFRKYVISTATWSNVAHNFGSTPHIRATVNHAGLLMAAGAGLVTYDGATWTSRTLPAGQNAHAGLASNGTVVMILGNDGKIATSLAGITWSARTAFATTPTDCCWSSVLQSFFACEPTAQGTKIWSCPDPTTTGWTLVSTVPNVSGGYSLINFSSIRACGSLLVATNAGASNSDYSVWYSSDAGVTWSQTPNTRLSPDASATLNTTGAVSAARCRVARTAGGVDTQMAFFSGVSGYFGMITGKP